MREGLAIESEEELVVEYVLEKVILTHWHASSIEQQSIILV